MRSLIKQTLPPFLHSWLREFVHLVRGNRPLDPLVVDLKRAHDAINYGCTVPELILREGLRFRLHPESVEPFKAFCYTYPPMVQEMDAFLRLTVGRQRLLDVGALHGVFSLAFVGCDPARRAVAVDASPIAFARLLYNIHQNSPRQVEAVECALSSQSGTVAMHYEWEHAVAAGTGGENSGQVVNMLSQRGDELCQRLSFEPDVIKIDVEGHEIKVLKGLESTIIAKRPIIFLEVHPMRIQQEHDSLGDLLSMLEKWRYEVLYLDGGKVAADEIVKSRDDIRVVLRPVIAN
jgi:FkbM family methyltransferase